ncbi:MAG: uroporphyrinogen decarboxylase family protein [Candidatus Korarchaeota archaeon]
MANMTGLDRAYTYLKGKRPDKMPLWHESMYLAWKYSGVSSLKDYLFDAEAIARGYINYINTFNVDITGAYLDQWAPYEVLGVEVEILDHVVQPKTPPWRYRPDKSIYERFRKIDNFEKYDPRNGKRFNALYKAWRILMEKVGDKVLFRQGIVGPAGTLALVVGTAEALRDVIIYPELLNELVELLMGPVMDWTVETSVLLAEAVDKQNFNMSFVTYDKEFTDVELKKWLTTIDIEFLKRVRNRIGWDVPITTHICSYAPDLDFIFSNFGTMVNELQFYSPGSTYPLEEAVDKFGDKIPLCTGIDHLGTLFGGTKEEIENMIKRSTTLGKKCKTFALGPGCGLALGTPEENIKLLASLRDKYGVWE